METRCPGMREGVGGGGCLGVWQGVIHSNRPQPFYIRQGQSAGGGGRREEEDGGEGS